MNLFTRLIGGQKGGFGILSIDSDQYPAIEIPVSDAEQPNRATLSLLLIGMTRYREVPESESSHWYFKDKKLEAFENGVVPIDKVLEQCKRFYSLPLVHILQCRKNNGSDELEMEVEFCFSDKPVIITFNFSSTADNSIPELVNWSDNLQLDGGKLRLDIESDAAAIVGYKGSLAISYDDKSSRLKAKLDSLQVIINRFVVPFEKDFLELPIEISSTKTLSFESQDVDWYSLTSLPLSDAPGFSLKLADFAPKLLSLSDISLASELRNARDVTLSLANGKPTLKARVDLVISGKDSEQSKNPFTVTGELIWNMETGAIESDFISFKCANEQILDIGLLALRIPENSQLNCTFSTSELTLSSSGSSTGQIFVPGNLTDKDSDFQKRFVFALKNSPDSSSKPLLKLRPAGISFYAELTTREVRITDKYSMQPISERNGMKSAIELKDSTVCQASFFAMMPVPGFSNTDAKVLASLALRQAENSRELSIHAELELDRKTEEPLGELSFSFFEAALDRSTFVLDWDSISNEWQLDAKADGRLSLVEPLPSFLSGLSKENPLSFIDLSLTKFDESSFSLNFNREPSLDILDGLFTARWSAMCLKLEDRILSKISCSNVTFSFNEKGAFDIEITPGELGFEFTVENPPKLILGGGKPLGIKARIGENVMMIGEAQLINEVKETGIGVSGHIEIEGLPSIAALMFIGTGRKNSGEVVPNICIYAAVDCDVQLYPGVYLKSAGLGVGINRSLAAVGLSPSPLQLLGRMGDLDPGKLNSWAFVPAGGTYLSLIGTLTIAAVAGNKKSPFVLWMLLCLDSNGVFTAAGKLWLASSVQYTKDNFDRPAIVASMVVIPQRRLLQMHGTTRVNPAIENDPGLAKILNSCSVRFSYIMSPSLMDYFIEEASFTTSLLGANAKIKGDYRFAITDKGALMRAGLVATADFKRKLSGGACGASFEAHLRLAMLLAGLIDEHGAVAYAKVDADMRANASLWVRVRLPFGGSKTFSKSAKLNVNLAGVLAFDPVGDTGFIGSAEASFSLCGFRASVDASLSINEGMVRKTESRVVAFERQVNKVRQRSIAQSATQISGQQGWQVRWYRIGSKLSLVVVPTGIGPWYGSLSSSDTSNERCWKGIDTIQVNLGDDMKIWKIGDYARTLIRQMSDSGKTLTSFDQLMLAACDQDRSQGNEDSTSHWLDADLIQDPRLQAGMRSWWREEDQLRLQAGVHPIDTRPIEEVEAAGLADSNFEDVVQFELFSRRSRRIGRHGFNRINIEEQHRQIARGWVVQHLLDQLDDQPPSDQSGFPVPMEISLPKEHDLPTIASIKVTYTDIDREDEVHELDMDASLDLCGLETCTPRQRTVLSPNPEDPGKLIGYQQVQLPIRFAQPNQNGSGTTAEVAIGEFLRGIRGLRVLRRLPGELEPSVIAEEVQIPFRWLSIPSASSDSSVSKANKFLVLLPSIHEDRFSFDEFELNGSTPLSFGGHYHFKNIRPIIEYFLEPIPVSAVLSPVPRLSFPPIPLQPIEPEPPLHNLLVVIPLSDSESGDDDNTGTNHQVINVENFRLARGIRKRAANSDDEVLGYQVIASKDNEIALREGFRLELWAEEIPDLNSGYYGRSNHQDADLVPKTVNDIAVESPKESTEFKIMVGTYRYSNSSRPELTFKPEGSTEIFRRHSRYRFFLRRTEALHKSETSSSEPDQTWYGGLLTPVAFAFARSCKNSLIESLDLRFFPWFEIPEFNQKQLLPASFDVYLDPAKDRNTLVIQVGARASGTDDQTDHRSPALAAVEILIRDQDEPHRCVTLERELLAQSDFLVDERDFRNASLWESDGPDLPANQPQQPQTNASAPNWYDEKKNIERSTLEEQLQRLSCKTWREAFSRLRSLYSLIYQYQQTSTFVNSYGSNWERLALAVRLLMAGVNVINNNKLETMELLTLKWVGLLDLMKEVESIDGQDLSGNELDKWLVRLRLVSILRHRLEIGQEIFGSEDDLLIEKSGNIDSKEDIVPLHRAWDESIKYIKANDTAFRDRLEQIIDFSMGDGGDTWWSFGWTKHSDFGLLDKQDDVEACVPHLTCLAIQIRELKTHLYKNKGWRLVKRPHNTVQTSTDSDGKRVPVPTPGNQLLPARLSESTPSTTEGLPPIFLANILERLGFAVDLAAYDSLGQPIPGAELYSEIAGYVRNRQPLDGNPRYIAWLPVENRGDAGLTLSMTNDAEGLQSLPQSYGFLKLAVVPAAIAVDGTLQTLAQIRNFDLDESTRSTLTRFCSLIFGVDKAQTILLIPVRPRGEQIQTLCLQSGIARCFWTESDLKRHRYEVYVRGINRYTPLERCLHHNGDESSSIASGAKFLINSQRRFIPFGPNSQSESLLAPTVYPRSDPHRVIFSYSLPAEGQRSLLNHLSAIRTGWHGVETQWLWRNPWIKNTTKASYDLFKGYIEKAETLNASGIDDQVTHSDDLDHESLAVAARNESLFRSERFMIAHYLPYCLEYNLCTRTHYEGTSGEWSAPHSSWIRRLPRILPPIQEAVKTNTSMIMFKLFCPSDLMTEDETEVLRRFKSESQQDNSSSPWIGDIPDPEIVYYIYLKQPFSSDSASSLYRLLDTVTVPFAQGVSQSDPTKAYQYSSASNLEYKVYKNQGSIISYFLGIDLSLLLADLCVPSVDSQEPPSIIVRSQYQGLSSPLAST